MMISSTVDDGMGERATVRARLKDSLKPVAFVGEASPTHGASAAVAGGVASQSSELMAEFVTTREGFEALEAEWDRLFQESGAGAQVFLTFGFCWNWHLSFNVDCGKRRRAPGLRILAVREGGRLVVICPMVEDRWLGLRRLSWFGSPVSQYGDLLVASGPHRDNYLRFAGAFLRHHSGADVLKLWKVRADSAAAIMLASIHRVARAPVCSETALSVDLSAVGGWEGFESRFPTKVRKNRRRQRRRLEERGGVAFDVLECGGDAARVSLEALDLKRLWLSARGRVSRGLANPGTARFFERIAGEAGHAAGTKVFRLSCEGKTAALAIGFVAKDRLVVHILVYNLELAATGAGALILEDIIRWCFDNGLSVCDLMAPGDEYKLEWCREQTQVCDWVVPISRRGRVFQRLRLVHAGSYVKSAVSWLPYRLRKSLAQAYGLVVPFIV